MQRIAVVDYGMGNLRSVSKALEAVAPDHDVVVTSDASVISSADKIVCPGQGAAADCMQALEAANLVDTIKSTAGKQPFFGICMGMQVLFDFSQENSGVQCMGIVPGDVKRFAQPLIDTSSSGAGERLKVPHMGWSEVAQAIDHPMWHNINNSSRFYFAHSYYCVPSNGQSVAATCHYGHEFAVAVHSKNLFACQFHPEKSSDDGLQLLANFIAWDGN